MIVTIKCTGRDFERWSGRRLEKMFAQMDSETRREEQKRMRKATR